MSLFTYISLDIFSLYWFSSYMITPVLLTAPQIPAGMTGFCWNGPESTGMRLESTGMGLESTGMNAFLQELITQQNKTKKILVINN